MCMLYIDMGKIILLLVGFDLYMSHANDLLLKMFSFLNITNKKKKLVFLSTLGLADFTQIFSPTQQFISVHVASNKL